MKKALLFFFAAAVFCFMSQAASAVNYPEPQGKMVNDFANILDAASKERIEKSLRDFEKRTTNEIAVAIVPDLQGEDRDAYAVNLFKKWGIGKKGKDNGVLLLIAIKERKWRFEVGYGLEGVLTDAQSGRIGRDHLVPHLKKGMQGEKMEFGRGIEESLGVVMNTIAPPAPKAVSPAEKQRLAEEAHQKYLANLAQQQKDKEAKERLASALKTGAITIFFLSIFGLLSFKTVQLIKRRKAERIRKEKLSEWLKTSIDDGQKKIAEAQKKVSLIKKEAEAFPKWEKANLSNTAASFSLKVDKLEVALDECKKKFAAGQIDEAADLMEDQDEGIRNLIKLLEKELNQIKLFLEELPLSRRKAQAEIAEAKKSVETLSKRIDSVSKLGFNLSDEGGVAARSLASLGSLKSKLDADDEDPDAIIKEVTAVLRESAKISGIIDTRERTKSNAEKMMKEASSFLEKIRHSGTKLEAIKQRHPKTAWMDLEEAFLSINAGALVSSITELCAEAATGAAGASVKADKAEHLLKQAEGKANDVRRILTDIDEREEVIKKAQKEYQSQLDAAEAKFHQANEKVGDSDVKTSRKTMLQQIRTKIEEGKALASSGSMVDWLAVAAILGAAFAMSGDLLKLAEEDISAAKSLRSKRNRHSSGSRRPSPGYVYGGGVSEYGGSSSSSSGSSDSGFSFGGGESGGGGAGGDF